MAFRSRYAGSVAREWSKTIVRATLGTATLGAALWGALILAQAWNSSEKLRVKKVVFSGDIPPQFGTILPVHANDHLVTLRLKNIEQEILRKFPELETFTLSRRWDRSVLAKGKYRTPIARTHAQGEEKAIDVFGVPFRMTDTNNQFSDLPWIETFFIEDRKTLLSFLLTWKKEVPIFYSLVKKIETDRMREMNVELSDGILVKWGPLNEADIINRTKRILKFQELFSPARTPAELLFVTTDRIVMDKNWEKRGTHVETRNFSGH